MQQSADDWASRHSDAWHPESRDDCRDCQEMIAAYGPMPPVEEIIEAHYRLLRKRPETGSTAKERANKKLRSKLRDSTRRALRERAADRCERCGIKGHLEIHHIIPLSEGGTHDLENLTLVCYECHRGFYHKQHLGIRREWA